MADSILASSQLAFEFFSSLLGAWIKFASGKTEDGLAQIRVAAEWEDKTEKHPVTPGPIIPARELLGDMLMQAGKPKEALAAYEHSMRVEPNRFRGLAGAARAAELAGERDKAKGYSQRLLQLAAKGDGERPILKMAREFVGAN